MGAIMNPPLTAGCTALSVCACLKGQVKDRSEETWSRLTAMTGGLAPVKSSPWGVAMTRRALAAAVALGMAFTLTGFSAPTSMLPSAEAPQTSTLRVGSVELAPCNVMRDAWCGSITRPWDAAGRVPGTLQVGFAWIPSSSGRSIGTLVPHEGGPGYSTTGSGEWFAEMYGDLMRNHDMLLVDQRGMGRTAVIACPALDQGTMSFIRAVGACGRSLGDRAYLYGTEASADDLAAVLDALEIDRVDMYGDSYGTFFGQVFAGRHGDRLRTLILDGAYPTYGESAWYPTQGSALRRAFTAVCARSALCAEADGHPLPLLDSLLDRLRTKPMSVRAPGGDGRWHNVVLDPEAVAAVAYNATYLSPTYREFTAAVRAALAGDARPLGRLFAEYWWTGDTSSNPRAYSSGAEAAVSCHDYPQLFDLRRSVGVRKEQYRGAFARKERTDPGLYAPFTITEYKRSGWTAFGMCLEWPKPPKGASFGPPKPIDGRYPAVPTLVLSGELDTITTAAEGDMVAERFPLSRHIVVANGLHVVGGARPDSCAPRLVRHVIRTGGLDIPASLEECAADAPIIRAVGTYPRALAGVQLPSGVDDDTVVRVTVTAANTAADLIDRWWQGYSDTGYGLRGGEWRYAGDARVRFTLTGVKLVRDLPVSGSFTWDRTTGSVSVDLRVPSASGVSTVSGSWNADDSGAMATLRVTGTLGPTTLVFPAP